MEGLLARSSLGSSADYLTYFIILYMFYMSCLLDGRFFLLDGLLGFEEQIRQLVSPKDSPTVWLGKIMRLSHILFYLCFLFLRYSNEFLDLGVLWGSVGHGFSKCFDIPGHEPARFHRDTWIAKCSSKESTMTIPRWECMARENTYPWISWNPNEG